ncbi:PDZ domain-containing protein [Aureispira anguillae]|uniref:PDZ domain-containing protein n=1 Tax=Aureispira anguillae TaxID=2864201 RepID=A0A915YIZ9_9BACT|nr:PDZ domain-containing protein [Aureispira anguillae]BDS14083.1 PDZ domain-containing protein [Aureispira anguillae]
MKTLFNRKSWLFTLSIAFAASSVSSPIFAQDHNKLETDAKVTIIRTTSNEKEDFFRGTTTSNGDKIYTYNSILKKKSCDNKPKLGVLLKGNEEGTVVLKTFPNSAAAEAGLQEGDKILMINGKKSLSIPGLIAIVDAHKIGDKVTIKYERNGVTQTRTATFKGAAQNHYLNYRTKYSNYKTKRQSFDLTQNACEKLNELYAKPFLGVYLSTSHQEDGTGAKLTSIIEGTGAAKALLKASDKIVKLNQQQIHSTEEAIAFIQSKKPGDKIRIRLLRENQPITIRATLGSWADNPNVAWKIATLEENCVPHTPETVVQEKKKTKKNNRQFAQQSSMEVFPNPTADFVNIKFKGQKAPLTIHVISLDGKEMYTQTIQNFEGNYNDQLDVSKYPSGIYIIHLTQNEEQITQQIIVE